MSNSSSNSDLSSENGLPSPLEFAQADVVIFDGKCNFCRGQVARLKRLDGKNRLAFISLHDEFVAEKFPDLSFDQLMSQMYVIPATPTGYSEHRFGGASAVRYLSRRLPILWPIAPVLHLPFSLPVWQRIYQWIAQRRYRIAGKAEACDPDGTCELHFKK